MIQFNYDDTATGDQSNSNMKANQVDHNIRRRACCNTEAESTNTALSMKHNSGTSETKIKQLTVFQARQINGCLIRAPTTFYTDIW